MREQLAALAMIQAWSFKAGSPQWLPSNVCTHNAYLLLSSCHAVATQWLHCCLASEGAEHALPVCSPPFRLVDPVAALQSGKTKFTIENATKTRIVLADTRIHILGSFANIRVARDALCSLILGSPPGKVYSKLRSVCSRLNDS
jgi:hypothetical protein